MKEITEAENEKIRKGIKKVLRHYTIIFTLRSTLKI